MKILLLVLARSSLITAIQTSRFAVAFCSVFVPVHQSIWVKNTIIMAFSRRAPMEKVLAAAGALQRAEPGHWQGKACGDQPCTTLLDGAAVAKGGMG